jgi:hypothetical protein
MSAVLEPELTRFDLRVLNALDDWPGDDDTLREGRLPFKSAWQVAERIGEYDVTTVRDTLRGLVHLGYASDRSWGTRQEWIKSWCWREKRAATSATKRPDA